MSIASNLSKLNTDINNAYNSISAKGGIIPTRKNTENLASSIESLTGGGVITYIVTFNSDGGTEITTQEVIKGRSATEPIPPTKTGFIFNYWALNGSKYDFNMPILSDITLNAVWEEDVKYTRIEYIQSTGTQYIDTGYLPVENTQFEIDLKDSNKSSYESYFGTTKPRLFRSSVSNNNLEYSCYNTSKIFSCDLSSRRILILNSTGIYDENMNLIDSSGGEYILTGDDKAILIFLSRYNGNPDKYGVYYLYGFKIYEGNVLKRNFIPVLDENNVACLYDMVEKKYYYNAGSGTFNAGQVIS